MFLKDKYRLKTIGVSVLLAGMGLSVNAANLEEAIRMAYDNVPAIKAQIATVEAANSTVGIVESAKRPQLQLNVVATNARYENSATRGRPLSQDTNIDSYNSELLFSQQLFDFGAVTQQVKAAKADASRTNSELTALRDVIARNVMIAYLDVQRFGRLLELAQQNVTDGEKLSEVINQRVNLGKTARVDSFLAKSQLSAARFQVTSQVGLLKSATIRYQELVGEMPKNLQDQAGPLSFPVALQEALDVAYQTSPQLAASNHAVAAAYAKLKAAKASRYPNLDVEMFFREGEDEAAVLGQNDSVGLNLRLSWQIYTGGRLSREIDQALALLTQAESARDDTRRLVDEEVRIAWSNLRTSIERLVHLKNQHEADERVYRAYQQQLKTGKRTPLDVFVVRRNLNQSRLAMDDGRYRIITDKYLVKAAMGTFAQEILK